MNSGTYISKRGRQSAPPILDETSKFKGRFTVDGTSVAALALLTYLRLWVNIIHGSHIENQWKTLHPTLVPLGDDFEAKNTIFGKIHVTL